MNRIVILLFSVFIFSCSEKKQETLKSTNTKSVIAFGSCAYQHDPQPILNDVAALKPDAFIYLGDNIYSDTYAMDTLRKNYQVLGAKPEFLALKAATKIYAVWDDHDYGYNDSGRHYPFKKESKEIFLDFFGDQEDSTIRLHAGIYHTVWLEKAGRKIQIIFPDMRTFRDKVLPYNGNRKRQKGYEYELDYSPYTTSDSTMLGEEQWKWLEAQLMMPADVKIIASSTQFSITHNGYEAWTNFPHEQQRFVDLIKKTKANGVFFISGDVHYAELSKLTVDRGYPLYDVTSSGITSTWDFATPNDNRIDGPVMENNFGLVIIDWGKEDPEITLQIHDVAKKKRIDKTIKLSELKF
jgi:alkaline phosphatase D